MASGKIITSRGLDIDVTHGEEGGLVRLHGRLNIDTSPALRDRLLAILQSEPREVVVVDLAEASYVDSSGIATLIEALKVARNHQTTLRLRGLQDRLLHLFQVTGVLSLFEANSEAHTRPTAPGSKVR